MKNELLPEEAKAKSLPFPALRRAGRFLGKFSLRLEIAPFFGSTGTGRTSNVPPLLNHEFDEHWADVELAVFAAAVWHEIDPDSGALFEAVGADSWLQIRDDGHREGSGFGSEIHSSCDSSQDSDG